jgi:hypothetical protein
MEAIMDGNEKARFDPQQQALFRRWITSPSAGYARQNPDGTPYREPQPTLTDEERAAVETCIADDEAMTHRSRAATLRGLLERLG